MFAPRPGHTRSLSTPSLIRVAAVGFEAGHQGEIATLLPDPHMPILISSDASPLCGSMAALIELLSEFPAERDRNRAEAFADRLSRLECEAHRQAACAETLAAIRGARVLLELTDLPPLPRCVARLGTSDDGPEAGRRR